MSGENLHIGLIIYGSIDSLSGGYLYDRKLVEHLRAKGDQVEIISLPWRTYSQHLLDNFSNDFFQRLVSLELDLLLQDELNHPSLLYLNRRLQARARYPILSIVHHLRSSEARSPIENGFYRWLEQRYLTSVDGFIYNSQATRMAVEGLIPPFKSSVPPGIVAYPAGDRLAADVREQEISWRAKQKGPLRILFVGNLIPRKGLHTLLLALAQLPDRLWRLVVVGSPEVDRAYVRRVERLAARLGVNRGVTFTGAASDEQLVRFMKSSDVLCVPSSYEGFGIVYLEGMSFGLPALAGRSGGAEEIITHGKDGYLVHANDFRELATYLEKLAQDRSLLEQMSLAALERYRAHPSWEETMQQVRAFLVERV